MTFDVGPFALKGGVTDANRGRGGFCPRRTVLDRCVPFAALHESQEATNRFFSALTGSTSIQAFMRPENIDRITASAQRLHATGS
jgi:hypothetical protein